MQEERIEKLDRVLLPVCGLDPEIEKLYGQLTGKDAECKFLFFLVAASRTIHGWFYRTAPISFKDSLLKTLKTVQRNPNKQRLFKPIDPQFQLRMMCKSFCWSVLLGPCFNDYMADRDRLLEEMPTIEDPRFENIDRALHELSESMDQWEHDLVNLWFQNLKESKLQNERGKFPAEKARKFAIEFLFPALCYLKSQEILHSDRNHEDKAEVILKLLDRDEA